MVNEQLDARSQDEIDCMWIRGKTIEDHNNLRQVMWTGSPIPVFVRWTGSPVPGILHQSSLFKALTINIPSFGRNGEHIEVQLH